MVNWIKKFKTERIKSVFARFPVAMLFACICTLSLLLLVREGIQKPEEDVFFKLAMSSFLGFLSAINIQLIIEHFKHQLKWVANIFPFIIAISSYCIWPEEISQFSYRDVGSFIGLIAIFHLTVSFIPHLRRHEINDFWEYNKNIFLRFVESGFFSAVIFIGLSLAILAMDQLFGMPTNKGHIYVQLFFLLSGIFHTIYFLSGFPTAYDNIYNSKSNKIYTIFSELLMIPITMLYMLILYAFAGKILFAWNLPQGWVAKMVLGFLVVGVFTYLLNFKQVNLSSNKLTQLFSKWFFHILSVPTILIFISIYTRISDYGLTENRYLIVLLGIWLVLHVLWFGLARKTDIRFIPISLFIFILFALFFPYFNMFTLPYNDQKSRFISELVDNDLVLNGKLQKLEDGESIESKALNEGLEFLYYRRNLKFLDGYMMDSVQNSLLQDLSYNDPQNELREIRKVLGLRLGNNEIENDQLVNLNFKNFNYYLNGEGKLLKISMSKWSKDSNFVSIQEHENQIILFLDGKAMDSLDITNWLNELPKRQLNLNEDESYKVLRSEKYQYSIMLDQIGYYINARDRVLNSMSGIVFVEEIKK